jgi:hypothetical protein
MTTHAMNNAVLALATMALLGGCAPMGARFDCASIDQYGQIPGDPFVLTPQLDCRFGDAVNMAVARQVIDKDAATKNAGKNAAGMDGASAKEAIDRYHKSFRTPEPATSAFTIGVTGGQSAGGAQ